MKRGKRGGREGGRKENEMRRDGGRREEREETGHNYIMLRKVKGFVLKRSGSERLSKSIFSYN